MFAEYLVGKCDDNFQKSWRGGAEQATYPISLSISDICHSLIRNKLQSREYYRLHIPEVWLMFLLKPYRQSAKERLWLTKKLWRLCLHFMSNSTEDLSVVASKFVVWQVNFVWTSSRPRLSKVMLLTVTPSLKEEEAEKMRPLRYHTTRGGGLPAKNTKKNTEKYRVLISVLWLD